MDVLSKSQKFCNIESTSSFVLEAVFLSVVAYLKPDCRCMEDERLNMSYRHAEHLSTENV